MRYLAHGGLTGRVRLTREPPLTREGGSFTAAVSVRGAHGVREGAHGVREGAHGVREGAHGVREGFIHSSR